MMKIILVGYMGAGKSQIAHLLSQKLNIKAVDLDEVIEKTTQLSVDAIFKSKGEIYFRKLERQLFLELIDSNENMVISLGGGTPCYANNHEILKAENVVSIYLKASVSTLYHRLSAEKMNRPLLATFEGDELLEFIAKHLFDRSFYYNHAMHKVTVDAKSVEEIVSEIEKLLA